MTGAPSSRRGFLARLIGGIAGGAWLARAVPARAQASGSLPYLGEIRMFAGTFAPSGWLLCQGQILPIAGNDPLFSLIGTTYGGDGVTTFAMPDLRGRVPVHAGPGYVIAQAGGVEQVTLTTAQIPAHTHPAGAASAIGDSADPTGRVPARNAAGVPRYGAGADTTLAATTMLATGGSGAHTNMQPYLGINFIICSTATSVYPSQT